MQQLAPLPARLASLLYEALTTFALLIIGYLIPQAALSALTRSVASPSLQMAHVFLLLAVYFVWQWAAGGQTLAMKTWRIKLVAADGSPLRHGQALLRYALAWPSVLCLGIGLLWSLIDRDRQFLHDRLAGTRLIRLPKPVA